MATAAKKTVTPRPRTPSIPKASITTNDDPSQVVEKAEGEKIFLGTPDPEGEKVTAVVPHKFSLMRDNGQRVEFLPGVQEMLVQDATHWFARASGVKIYQPE